RLPAHDLLPGSQGQAEAWEDLPLARLAVPRQEVREEPHRRQLLHHREQDPGGVPGRACGAAVRLAARILRATLIVGFLAVPGVTGVAAAAAAGLSLTALPADHASVAGADQISQIYAHFSAPIVPLTPDTFTIHEVVNDVVGPPLAGGTVTTTDDGSTWVLQLPSMLASSAIYEVQVAGAQTPDGTSTLTTSWRFSVDGTGPPPKALTSLLAIAADSAVGLSWSVPVDFD